ncbi:MAG: winged helix-turn-helix domain-containing protein [Roseomonas sp.]|nr:winged helix-turn-helix domain-containing protein [Roseomonas sp.]
MRASETLRFGGVVFDPVRGSIVAANGAETVLRAKTLALLGLLLESAGRVVSANEILDRIWGDVTVTPDSVTQCIGELRRAFGPAGTELLKTLPRRGYVLTAAPDAPPSAPALMEIATPEVEIIDRPADHLLIAASVPTLAVLRPRWLGPDPEDPWLTEGIAHDITEILTRFREPVVISSNSSRLIGVEGDDFSEAARKLCARYLVTSVLRSSGERLRLSIGLEDASSGARLWSDSVNLRREELFDFQDEAASRIAHALVPQIAAAELRCSLRRPPEHLGAYHLLLRAREMIARLDRESFTEAGRLLEYALGIDAGYGNLHGAHAGWLTLRMFQGWSNDWKGDKALMEKTAKIALRLDPDNARTLSLFGHSRTIMDEDCATAEIILKQAFALAPNDVETLCWTVPTLSYIGQSEEAIRRAQRALSLSPLDPFRFRHKHFLSLAYYASDKFTDAVNWGLKASEDNPNYTSNLRVTIAALVALNRINEGKELAKRLLQLQPSLRANETARKSIYRDKTKREDCVASLIQAGIPA